MSTGGAHVPVKSSSSAPARGERGVEGAVQAVLKGREVAEGVVPADDGHGFVPPWHDLVFLRRRIRRLGPELESAAARGERERDRGSVAHLAREELPRQRVLDQFLDVSLQRPRAVHRVERLAREPRRDGRLPREPDPARRDELGHLAELDLDDLLDVGELEAAENDDVVDAVQELGPEVRPELRLDPRLERLLVDALELLDEVDCRRSTS